MPTLNNVSNTWISKIPMLSITWFLHSIKFFIQSVSIFCDTQLPALKKLKICYFCNYTYHNTSIFLLSQLTLRGLCESSSLPTILPFQLCLKLFPIVHPFHIIGLIQLIKMEIHICYCLCVLIFPFPPLQRKLGKWNYVC